MIFVHFTGGFGNNLSQYIIGYILSIKHNTSIVVVPQKLSLFLQQNDSYNAIYNIINLTKCTSNTPKCISTLSNDNIDTLNYNNNVKINSCIGTFRYFLPYKDDINTIIDNDMVISLRLGTNCEIGINVFQQNRIPFDFYERCITNINPINIFICSDTFDDQFLDNFTNKYTNIHYINKSTIEQFKLMVSAKHLVIHPKSSFCLWASFLSSGSIYAPLTYKDFIDDIFIYDTIIYT
jgi:hypothetical protein